MPGPVRTGLISAAAAALCAAAGAAAAEEIAFDYDVYVGGSPVAEMQITVARTGDRYRMTTAVGLVGLAGVFSDWRASSQSEGMIADGRIIPQRYASYNVLRGEERHVEMYFADGVVTEVVVEPSAEEDERDPVTAADWQGAVDPLAAVLAASLSPDTCGGDQRLFDGRRVTEVAVDATAAAEAPQTDYGIYAGPATLCAYTVESVAGLSRRWEGERGGPEETQVWFAPIAGDLAVPVRLEADTRFGAMRGHLVAIRASTATN